MNPEVLIIPDIHGRTFWKEAINKFPKEDYPNLKIVFLGDYLDPYTGLEDISAEDAYNNFLEVLEYINNDSRIIPLIGNHDWHYFVNLDSCRIDRARERDIEELFKNNLSKFRLTYTIELDDVKYLFSHAGITQRWLNDISDNAQYEIDHWNPYVHNEFIAPLSDPKFLWLVDISEIKNTYNFEILEKCLQNYDNTFYTVPMSMISRDRGGWNAHGSCIWADIHEHIYNEDLRGYFQIFAHTNTYPKYTAIIPDGRNWAMLDSAKAYILDIEGNIEQI